MPDPPSVDILTRYVYENPYTLGPGLLVVGVVVGWWGLREGHSSRSRLGAAALGLGLVVLLVGTLVVTSGERARDLTESLIDAVVAGDVPGAMGHLAGDATLHLGLVTNVGLDVGTIETQLDRVTSRYGIERNQILGRRSYSVSRDEAVVHLSCLTTGDVGSARSRWVIEVGRNGAGTWKVDRMTCVSINGSAPRSLR